MNWCQKDCNEKEEDISLFAVRPLYILSVATLPVVKFLNASTNVIVRLFGIDPNQDEEEVTEEEIRMMVMWVKKGAIQENEKEMINNIFDFDNKTAMDIMTTGPTLWLFRLMQDLKK